MELMTDIGSMIKGSKGWALDPATITAAAGNDGVAVNGNVIDLNAMGAGRPLSCKIMVFYKTTLGNTLTLSIAAKLQHGAQANLSDAADLESALAATVVETGVVTAKQGVAELSVNLSGAKQYVRVVVTADLSAPNTDTVLVGAVIVFGGQAKSPAA